MKRLIRTIKDTAEFPDHPIILLCAMFMLVFGVCGIVALFTPIGGFVHGHLYVYIPVVVIYMISGVGTLVSFLAANNWWFLRSTFILFCCYIFSGVVRLVSHHHIALQGLIMLVVAAIVGICRLSIEFRSNKKRR